MEGRLTRLILTALPSSILQYLLERLPTLLRSLSLELMRRDEYSYLTHGVDESIPSSSSTSPSNSAGDGVCAAYTTKTQHSSDSSSSQSKSESERLVNMSEWKESHQGTSRVR